MGVSPKPSTHERRGGPFLSAPPQRLALTAAPICRVQQGASDPGVAWLGSPRPPPMPLCRPCRNPLEKGHSPPSRQIHRGPRFSTVQQGLEQQGVGGAPAAPAPSPAVQHTLGLLRDLRPGPRPHPCSRWGSARCPPHSLGATAAPKPTSLLFHAEPQAPWPPAA